MRKKNALSLLLLLTLVVGMVWFSSEETNNIANNKDNTTSEVAKEKIPSIFEPSDNVIVEKGKYTHEELKKAEEKLRYLLINGSINVMGIDEKQNRVLVFTNDEKVKADIINLIGADIVIFGPPTEFEFVDQSSGITTKTL